MFEIRNFFNVMIMLKKKLLQMEADSTFEMGLADALLHLVTGSTK